MESRHGTRRGAGAADRSGLRVRERRRQVRCAAAVRRRQSVGLRPRAVGRRHSRIREYQDGVASVTPPLQAVLLGVLGLAVGTLGTLVGAGGGFILLPLLALLYPHEPAANLTAISLAVVCVNAMSGTIAYARMRRVDFRSGLIYAAAGLPGSILGAFVTHRLDRHVFDPLLGSVLILGAIFLLRRKLDDSHVSTVATRRLVASDGTVDAYSPRLPLGALLSAGIGFLSSLLGIGGGIIHVPSMVFLLGFPTHVATATSHFVLALLSFAGVAVHARTGTLAPEVHRTLPIAVGVLVGAQIGAALSPRIHGRWILRVLALAIASVGVRLLLPH